MGHGDSAANLDVWHVPLTTSRLDWWTRWRGVLSDDEIGRAERLLLPSARRQFVLSHVALRYVLAGYLRTAPGALPLSRDPHGKPQVHQSVGAPVHFNLTHTADVALIAVSPEVPVGVDVEQIRPWPRELLVTSGQFFSDREQHLLEEVPPHLLPQAFARCWTRKEAMVKAMGAGLTSWALAGFDVGVWPVERDCGPRWHDGRSSGWTLSDVGTVSGCVASVASAGTAHHVRCRFVAVEELAG